MSQVALLVCRCGEVEGRVANASPAAVNRIVCYCADCQAFLHHLERAELLDAHGGTDIVQVAPASLSFHRGADRIVGVRLGPKGLFRWYAGCCKTPVGNTVTPAIPFVGIVAQAFEGGQPGADAVFGKPRGAVRGEDAVGTPPEGSTKPNLPMLFRAARLLLGWKIRGRAWPHPFFDRGTRAPIRQVTILPRDEREALRALCGPRPAA